MNRRQQRKCTDENEHIHIIFHQKNQQQQQQLNQQKIRGNQMRRQRERNNGKRDPKQRPTRAMLKKVLDCAPYDVEKQDVYLNEPDCIMILCSIFLMPKIDSSTASRSKQAAA